MQLALLAGKASGSHNFPLFICLFPTFQILMVLDLFCVVCILTILSDCSDSERKFCTKVLIYLLPTAPPATFAIITLDKLKNESKSKKNNYLAWIYLHFCIYLWLTAFFIVINSKFIKLRKVRIANTARLDRINQNTLNEIKFNKSSSSNKFLNKDKENFNKRRL